jgi:hypothetical protein
MRVRPTADDEPRVPSRARGYRLDRSASCRLWDPHAMLALDREPGAGEVILDDLSH